jgi:hypothetical protein
MARRDAGLRKAQPDLLNFLHRTGQSHHQEEQEFRAW